MTIENDIIYDDDFFDEVKKELNITWDDEDTDASIQSYIKQGVELLQNDVGAQIDFETDITARGLVKTYCRYARNNSEEFFIENNLSLILKLEVAYGKD